MMTTETIKRGFKNGFTTTWQLSKIMVPIFMIVVFLKHSGILEKMAEWVLPAMGLLGLPGEAAYALILGNVLNLYAAIGAMSAIPLTGKEITIMAVMLVISHNLLVETAVIKSCGVKVAPFVAVRIILALVAGMALNIIL